MDPQQLEICIKGLQGKDPRSQSLFYKYCFSELMKVALRYHANQDDAAASFNQAMLQVFKKINSYKREGPIMGWVRRIIVNTCINNLRSSIRYQSEEINDERLNSFQVEPDIYATLETHRILALVQRLPEATRLVFNLYIMEGYTHEQIADELKISKGTSKWHLNNARTLLKDQLIQMKQHESYILQK